MPTRTVPNSDVTYQLLCYDAEGVERPEGGVNTSEAVADRLRSEAITDVILVSHGWKGDIPSAIDQYDRWINAMLSCTADRNNVRLHRPGFNPLIVGLHWPSLAWGDENLDGHPSSFAIGAGADSSFDRAVDDFANALGGGADTVAAVRIILESANSDITPDHLPPDVVDAYARIDSRIGLGNSGEGAAPGDDREVFDAEAAYQAALTEEESADFGGIGLGGVLAPLRMLTFWSMKRRALRFGEGGANSLLRLLQEAVPEDGAVRIHLAGHSFGCIVVSACVAGKPGTKSRRPVHSVLLVQGAMSLWSYSSTIPAVRNRSGYFHRLLADNLVAGPVITTRSIHDRAVRFFYPLGASATRDIEFAPGALPKYGGIGTFGAQGTGFAAEDIPIGPLSTDYEFTPDKVFNIDATAVIKSGRGPSGAHSDISHPEIAHLAWEAINAP
ncbi:hypothetical protein SAMN04244553_1360 [Nocardia amikacinitolerans]|uniref:Alpha/beta hydrolase n=1 Tax=Nocardia amikacinitolerans TaxID=756689 RepID=A0A285L1C4_9NOCA|nr:hypothetical protein [Nocardia amikacinitolerans]SNY78685.1 hypothetical protein SAMN04244553_1360 [Nocardia amikacinitolerans]